MKVLSSIQALPVPDGRGTFAAFLEKYCGILFVVYDKERVFQYLSTSRRNLWKNKVYTFMVRFQDKPRYSG